MDEVMAQPDSNILDRDCADAYAAFWQCMDADDLTAPTSAVDPEYNAYEQYWSLMDAD